MKKLNKEKKKIGVAWEKDKVRMINIIGKPIGIVTKWYYESNTLSPILRWVRLSNGVLLKDVSENEFEYIKFVEITS